MVRLFVLVLLMGLAACEGALSDDDTSDELTRDDWVAATINGKAVIKPGRVTLAFLEGRVSGRSGCNLYSGPVEIGRGSLKVGPLISTKMACLEDGLMQQESAYLSALQSTRGYELASGTLTIATGSGPLVYKRAPRQSRPE